jgi:hypothetical protein
MLFEGGAFGSGCSVMTWVGRSCLRCGEGFDDEKDLGGQGVVQAWGVSGHGLWNDVHSDEPEEGCGGEEVFVVGVDLGEAVLGCGGEVDGVCSA